MQDLTIVFENNNEAVTSSRLVADYFSKRHDHILRDIENLQDKVSPQFWGQNFLQTQYQSKRGLKTEYLMTKDGFTILAMGFTGTKAMQFKEAYINAFNKMQNLLKSNDRIMQLEQRILTLEETKEPFKAINENNIIDDYFKTIKKKLDTQEYYIKGRSKTNGQLLGIETPTIIYLIATETYNIYKENTQKPVNRQTLSNMLLVKNIIIPDCHKRSVIRKIINKNQYYCYAFIKDKIQQYL